MISRIPAPLKLIILLIVAATGVVMLLVRPAAQTNDRIAIEAILRTARIIADILENPTFMVGQETVDGDELIRFYQLRNSRLAWSGGSRAAADAIIAMDALSKADQHGLDADRYHMKQIVEREAPDDMERAVTYDLLLTDAMLKHVQDLRKGPSSQNAFDNDIVLPVPVFDAVVVLNSALEAGRFAELLAGLAPPKTEHTPSGSNSNSESNQVFHADRSLVDSCQIRGALTSAQC